MATAQSVIENFFARLDTTNYRGTAALDDAVKAVSNFSSWEQLKSTMVADCASYKGDGTSFLKDMCDIVLDNSDTGAISGSDAGGGSTKTAESVVPESGSWTYPTSTSFTTRGLTVTVPEQSSLSSSEQFIVGALYTWWVGNSLDLISDSYGIGFNSSSATVKEIDINFYNSSSDGSLAYTQYSTGRTGDELHMFINMNYYSDISTTDPNGVGNSSASTYLDRTIVHELVHAAMSANINYFNSFSNVFKEGTAELIHGIDDKRKSTIEKLSKSSSSLKSALNSETNSELYSAGYMLLRYLAKQAAADRDPSDSTDTDTDTDTSTSTTTTSTATFSGNTLTVTGDFSQDIWLSDTNLLTGETSAYANSSATVIDASQMTSNHILAGNANDNSIISGSGGASLWGGTGGNDTLVGGTKSDTFWYMLGNGEDVIQNFTAGTGTYSDVLNVYGGGAALLTREDGMIDLLMNDSATLHLNTSGEVNTAVKFTSDNATVLNVKVGNTASANDFTYDSNVQYYFGGNAGNTLTVDGAEIYLENENFVNITTVNAQSSSNNNLLYGDSASNTLIGGGGTSSLWGGTGQADDVLIGGSGENIFRYGLNEGNDTLSNTKSTDTLNLYNVQVSDIVSVEYLEGDAIKANFSSGSLTFSNSALPTVNLADGTSWAYDSAGKTFSQRT